MLWRVFKEKVAEVGNLTVPKAHCQTAAEHRAYGGKKKYTKLKEREKKAKLKRKFNSDSKYRRPALAKAR